MAEWEGVRIGHYRFEPGRIEERIRTTTQVLVSFSGQIALEGSDDGFSRLRRRTAGDIGIIPSGIRYTVSWEEALDHLSVCMRDEFLERATADFGMGKNARLVAVCPQDALVRSIARALAAELKSGMPSGTIYAESLVHTLAVHLLRHYSTDSLIPDLLLGGLPLHKLRRVIDFIEANLERNLALAELAREADLSVYHFVRAFKQSMSVTPIQFLMQRRIERAKELLADSERPLSEIALRVGFKNQSHFTTLFRKFTEVTPKAWRSSCLR
jgi:AraC family transcriptional regulator